MWPFEEKTTSINEALFGKDKKECNTTKLMVKVNEFIKKKEAHNEKRMSRRLKKAKKRCDKSLKRAKKEYEHDLKKLHRRVKRDKGLVDLDDSSFGSNSSISSSSATSDSSPRRSLSSMSDSSRKSRKRRRKSSRDEYGRRKSSRDEYGRRKSSRDEYGRRKSSRDEYGRRKSSKRDNWDDFDFEMPRTRRKSTIGRRSAVGRKSTFGQTGSKVVKVVFTVGPSLRASSRGNRGITLEGERLLKKRAEKAMSDLKRYVTSVTNVQASATSTTVSVKAKVNGSKSAIEEALSRFPLSTAVGNYKFTNYRVTYL